jgi:hypothetical protein
MSKWMKLGFHLIIRPDSGEEVRWDQRGWTSIKGLSAGFDMPRLVDFLLQMEFVLL